VPGVRRMVPAVGKDWNDRLLAEQGVTPKAVQTDRQAFKALWKWHRVASEKGHSAAYLKRIAEVARDVVDGKPLSEKALGAMEKDCRQLKAKAQTEDIVSPAGLKSSRLESLQAL
jgi:hypothetical protein